MAELFKAITDFFQEDGWPYAEVGDEPALRLGFRGENGEWACYAQAQEEYGQFIFYSICPVNAPSERRMHIAELLTRANYGLILGNFELDFEDGEIRYKTSIGVEEQTLNDDLIKAVAYPNVLMMDKYLPAIMSVLYGDVPPGEAITQVEDEDESE